MFRKVLSLFLVLVLVSGLSLSLVGCNSTEDSNQANNDKKFAGTEITALLPPWYEFSQTMLDEFENETGIKVNLQSVTWKEMEDKIFTSCAAGVAPADITDVDWAWVGNFGRTGWYEPLNKYFDDKFFSDITTKDVFKYKDNYMAIPIYNDFRLTYINKSYFKAAGIAPMPTTPDEVMQAAIKIKESGACEYPLAVPMSATSATTTPWFLLTKAYGGELFDENWEPLFEEKDSPGYKAMEFLIKGVTEYKIIDPASVGLEGTDIVEGFKEGKGAIDLAGWAGNVSSYTNPEESKIASDVEIIKVPGINGKSRTYGLQEGLGIPAASKNKEAAAEFIKYLNKSENVKKLFLDLAIFPNHQSTIAELVEEDKLPGGETVLEVMPTIEPLFPQGAPSWFTELTADVSATMNQMAKGSMTLDEGMKHIADSSRKFVKESK